MLAHLDAIKSALAPLLIDPYSYKVALVGGGQITEGVALLVLSAPPTSGPAEDPECGTSNAWSVDVRVKAVAADPAGVLPMLATVKSLLSPGGIWRSVAVPGRSVQVRWLRSEALVLRYAIEQVRRAAG